MRIAYDNVYGNGLFAPGVTDALPNMLQVSQGVPNGKLCWRRVTTDRFGPYWLSKSGQVVESYMGFHHTHRFFVGPPLSPDEATQVIKRYKRTLQRIRGTFIVQLRERGWLIDGRMGYIIALYHTTIRLAEATNPGCPDGFPAKL
jgi:hypothetical protein